MLRIALGADHAGYRLKEKIAEHLKKHTHDKQNAVSYDTVYSEFLDNLRENTPIVSSSKYDVVDFGTSSEGSVDYPDIGIKVAQAVQDKDCKYGILICGTGVGMSITANKVHRIRAALCFTPYMARLCREHNDANILVLGSRVIKDEIAMEMVDIFLTTEFAGGRHERRIRKIAELEDKN